MFKGYPLNGVVNHLPLVCVNPSQRQDNFDIDGGCLSSIQRLSQEVKSRTPSIRLPKLRLGVIIN